MDAARIVLFFLVLLVQWIDGRRSKCPGCDPVHAGTWMRRRMAFSREFKDVNDECEHRRAFEQNLEFIADFDKNARRNPGVFTWQVGQNGNADKTQAEMRSMRGFKSLWQMANRKSWSNFFLVWDPSKCTKEEVIVDYTAEGFVTPVKDQGYCGSCWTFSATGAIEGQVAKRKYDLPNLSEQHLLDCANETYNSSGCDGGFMRGAFQFVVDNCGIVTSDAYPYTGIEGECSPPKGAKSYTCKSYRVVEPNEESLLSALRKYGPIACGMDASLRSFQLYTNGIYNDRECSNELNHAVLIVGAGTSAEGIDYWLIKNSWGINWGEYGYFKLLRGANLCNIVGDCSFPYYCGPKH